MKIIVIGATGHIGCYLVPALLREGHTVYAVARGNKQAYGYQEDEWAGVHWIYATRDEFCADTRRLEEIATDVVCDLISYHIQEVDDLLASLDPRVHYIQIGSIWTYENKLYLPVDEQHPKNARGNYGKNKGLIEDYLLDLTNKGLRRCTIAHPGHISGKWWVPINPQGNLNPRVYSDIKEGREIVLPHLGMETLHHIHSGDLTAIIIASIRQPDVSVGEAYIAAAPSAMTLRAMTEEMYVHFGHEPKIRYASWEEFASIVGETDAGVTLDHISHSPVCTPEKVQKQLGIHLKYSIMDILYEYMETT
ncbi:MAG TPA: epimerase [Clostridiales bacterium]|nr:epimerase [Clostridiales bacterium]